MRRVYKAGDANRGRSRRASDASRCRARVQPANITRLTSFAYPRVSNALRNYRGRVARVHAKEIAHLFNRSLPRKISQGVILMCLLRADRRRVISLGQ